MDFHIAVEIPPATETGKRTGFRFNAWSAALSGMWKMRSKSRISLTSTCWCVLRKKNPQTKEWLIPSEIHDQIMQNLWFEFPHPFPKGMECWDTSMVVNVDPTAFAVVLFFSTSCFPPKATPKTLCFKMFQKDNDFSAGSGKLKVNMGPSVESFSQKLKNHPIRASGIQNSARIPFFTEKCSHGCKDIAIHGMGHNGPHDSLMKDTMETKRFAIHINKAQGCKNLKKMITDLGSLHINL